MVLISSSPLPFTRGRTRERTSNSSGCLLPSRKNAKSTSTFRLLCCMRSLSPALLVRRMSFLAARPARARFHVLVPPMPSALPQTTVKPPSHQAAPEKAVLSKRRANCLLRAVDYCRPIHPFVWLLACLSRSKLGNCYQFKLCWKVVLENLHQDTLQKTNATDASLVPQVNPKPKAKPIARPKAKIALHWEVLVRYLL